MEYGLVTFQTSQGIELRGTLHKLGWNQVVFETYSPEPLLQMSEVLSGRTDVKSAIAALMLRKQRAESEPESLSS